jgi:hypothetical protein
VVHAFSAGFLPLPQMNFPGSVEAAPARSRPRSERTGDRHDSPGDSDVIDGEEAAPGFFAAAGHGKQRSIRRQIGHNPPAGERTIDVSGSRGEFLARIGDVRIEMRPLGIRRHHGVSGE